MSSEQPLLTSRGITDAHDRLTKADELLAELQRQAGGTVPGTLAVPELLELVRHARQMDLKIARDFSAFDGHDIIRGFARIRPLQGSEGGGCELLLENWQRMEETRSGSHDIAALLDASDRAAAEANGRLDARQHVQYLAADAPDTKALRDAIAAEPGGIWTRYVVVKDAPLQDPTHWRLVDSSRCTIPGSHRDWRVRLIPIGQSGDTPRAFEFLLIPDQPIADARAYDADGNDHSRLMGSSLAPALRAPITRIIENADTIRARLSGPLRDEYSEYAGHIVSAGAHLSGMLDDVQDLAVVEAPDFETAREPVDLHDAARRAADMLGVRARERGISLRLPDIEQPMVAVGEVRRVLQILINLLGNAIAHSPDGSTVTVEIEVERDGLLALFVRDEGNGIDPQYAERVFDKFTRLGQSDQSLGAGGSGLGLYISRHLAQAMGGTLVCVAAESGDWEGRGATFRLSLPTG
ncbi:MAG: HAMP domain-containing sensor histidine kinase [Erythrobacter sp.]